MDNTNSSSVTPPSHNNRSNHLKILAFGLISGLLFIGGYALGLENKNISSKETTEIISTEKNGSDDQSIIKKTNWKKPVSKKTGFTFSRLDPAKNGSLLFTYSIADKKLHEHKNVLALTGYYTVGSGTSDPHNSPNHLYAVYIDQEKQNLWLLSHETLEKKQITEQGKVAYITGWSPDSKKILYQVADNTIKSQTEGMGYPESKIQFDPSLNSGFFLFNIETGETKKLSPLTHVETFIDEQRVLAKPVYESDRLVVFDTETFEADFGFIKELFPFGASQFQFQKDGKKWTYTLSRNPTNDANIIYADFPNKEGIEIDKGNWADVQFPYLSPEGSKIAYLRREGYREPGVPNEVIWIYDTKSQSNKGYIPGFIETWVNENTIAFSRWTNSVQEKTYYLLDLQSGNVEEMK